MNSIGSRLPGRGARAGFTLLEVLVASVILATAIVGAMGAFTASSRTLGLAQFNATVTQLAQGKLAEVRTLDELPLGESEGDFGEEYPGFTWQMSVQEITDLPVTEQSGEALEGLFEIDLTVIGRALGRERQVSFSTYTM